MISLSTLAPAGLQVEADAAEAKSIGITGTLSSHGVGPEHLDALVRIASADGCHQTNPRPCTAADFERMFRSAM